MWLMASFAYLEMELDIDRMAFLVDQLESVRSVAVHVTETVRGSAVGHEEHDLVNGLGTVGPEVPHGLGIL